MEDSEAIQILAALAQQHRLAIFRLLVRHGKMGLAAGEIGEQIGISATGASFHLKELARAGLIDARREGRFIRYSFNPNAMRGFLSFLMDDCCQGRPELCGDLIGTIENSCIEETSNG